MRCDAAEARPRLKGEDEPWQSAEQGRGLLQREGLTPPSAGKRHVEAVHLAREPGGDLVDHKDREIFRHGEERGEREWGLAVGWRAEVGGAWESTLLTILFRTFDSGIQERDLCGIGCQRFV